MLKKLEEGLIEVFPEYGKKISVLLERDHNFRELANDYLFCRTELAHLSKTGKKDLFEQYKETIQDLEEEILACLKLI